ncbi:MAG: universal stress protein [Pseudomonadales bacterium]
MSPNHLLTILDKPKHAQTALDRSLAIQAQTDARVDLVSFCWNPLTSRGSGVDAAQRKAIKTKMIKDRKAWLQALLAGRATNGQPIDSEVAWTDDIADWVASRVENGIDLVVKSAHPSKTLLHTPLDWALLSTVQAPMLFASSQARRLPAKKDRAVLAAIDLRHADPLHRRLNRRVLAAAAQIAELREAKLHCVCAIELSTVLRDLDVIDERAVKRRLLQRSKDELEQLLARHPVPKTRRHFPIGKAGLTVNQIARKLKAEVLVVGTNAHRTRMRLGLGNSAQRILSRAVCDVLAVSP